MKTLLIYVGAIAFFIFGAVQIYAAFLGVEHYFGSGWATTALILTILLKFTLPVTVGAFFGAMDVWGWHWAWAAVFAAPGLVLVVPGVIASLVDYYTERRAIP